MHVLAWVCMSLCTEEEKEKEYAAAEACSEERCGKSSLTMQQLSKNCIWIYKWRPQVWNKEKLVYFAEND